MAAVAMTPQEALLPPHLRRGLQQGGNLGITLVAIAQENWKHFQGRQDQVEDEIWRLLQSEVSLGT